MIRSLAAVLLLASGWSWTGLGLDRLRWNERERSQAGIESLEDGREQEALEAFETAARLEPEDPLLRFNAGSAHLVAGSEDGLPHLEAAAGSAAEALAPPAHYNLGNARIAAGDTAGAIEAYEQALRLAPDYEDAKFNLELALRRQQQKEQEQEDQKGESQDQNDPQDEQEQQAGEDQNQQGEQPPEQPEQQEPQEQPGSDSGEPETEGQSQGNEQLPQFEEQPDMTAEQAAAILEAVENLEREQRRLQAAEEMKQRPKKGKDW